MWVGTVGALSKSKFLSSKRDQCGTVALGQRWLGHCLSHLRSRNKTLENRACGTD